MSRYLHSALVGLALWVGASLAHANVPLDETAYVTGGFGKWIIDSLFDAGSITNQPDSAGIIGTTLIPLSMIAMLVAVVIIILKSIQHLLVVAQAKDIEQSPVSMTWAPLHMVIAIVLIMPLPSGYSMGQYAGIWLAQQSNTIGNWTASRATNFFRESGVITPPTLPSVQQAVDGIIASQMCMAINNKAAQFVQANGGVPITIQPRPMTEKELGAVGGTQIEYNGANGLTRSGVTFGRARQGGFLGGDQMVDDYCGAVVVQYTAKSEGMLWQADQTVPLQRQGASNINSTPAEACQFGPLCIGGVDATYKNAKEAAINTFATAHNTAAQAFQQQTNAGSQGQGIANTLIWDIDTYFEGKSDSSKAAAYAAMQANEQAQIDTAVTNTIKLIDAMQSNVYGAYAGAINTFMTQRNAQTGNNFLDTIDRVGWPVLGLYWFQYTNFSQQVMDSVSMQTVYTGDLNQFITTFADMVDDRQLGARLETRIRNYRSALTRELQNTRFDSNPTSMAAPTNASISAKMFAAAEDALDIREAFPLIREELIANAGKGAMNPENMIEQAKQSINTVTRGTIFPFIIAPLREDNLVNGLVNTGHNIITVSEIIYAAKVTAEAYQRAAASPPAAQTEAEIEEEKSTWKKLTSFFKNPLSMIADVVTGIVSFAWHALNIVLEDFASFWFYVFLMGLFLAFYVPAMIMIQWVVGLVTWIIYIVEATVIIPLWGLLFTADMGQKAFAPQTAQQGFVHMLSILVYPSLMTIGFIIGLKVIDLISTFLVEYLLIGVMNTTDGYVFGILSLIAGLFIIGLACYQIIVRVFSLVLELNDRAMSWIGNRQGYGEGQLEGQVRGGINAAIGKVEIGKRMSTGKGNPMLDAATRPKHR